MRFALLACLMFALAIQAQARILTRCGASAGFSYYLPHPLVGKDTGWQKDGVSQGQMQLILDGNDYDVIYTDNVGTRSSRADGFRILNLPGAEGGRLLLVGAHPSSGAMEHWLFSINERGEGVVVWGTIRSGANFPKSSLMKADCSGSEEH